MARSYQQGTVLVRDRKYGTAYETRWRERQPNGGWQQRTKILRDCASKKEAQEELDAILKDLNGRNGNPVRSVPFSEVLETLWPLYLDNAGVKPSTRYVYTSMVKNWIAPFFGAMKTGRIQASDISRFMAHLTSKGLSAKTRRNAYSLLKLLFDVAVENDVVKASPVRPKIHRPRFERQEKPILAPDEARRLLEAVDPVWRAPLYTLALTGIRAGELRALRWQDVDLRQGRIFIRHSLWKKQLVRPKTSQSIRRLRMPTSLRALLESHRQQSRFTEEDDFVFCQGDGTPIDSDSLRRLGIYPALKRAGLPMVKGASGCHMFRHLAGSILHSETGSLKLAQLQLGHSNIGTTGDIYTHVDDAAMEKAAEVLGEVLGSHVVSLLYEKEDCTKYVQ